MGDDDLDGFVVRMKLKGDEAVAVFQEENEGKRSHISFKQNMLLKEEVLQQSLNYTNGTINISFFGVAKNEGRTM